MDVLSDTLQSKSFKMKFRVLRIFGLLFLIQFFENVENSQLFPICGVDFKNSGGNSFGGRQSERLEAPWFVIFSNHLL